VKKSNSESKVSPNYCEAAEEEKHPRVLFYWTDPLDKLIKQTDCANLLRKLIAQAQLTSLLLFEESD
jgi:hypothetical protein